VNNWDGVVRRHARETMRAWRAQEAKAAEGRLRDLKRRLDNRLDWYQRNKPVKGERSEEKTGGE
jgi:hypothetical protein